MKKFGGDFEFDEEFLINNRQNPKITLGGGYKNILYFSSARGAIYSLLNFLNIKQAVLPAFICDSVIEIFRALNIDFSFYKINPDLSIDIMELNKQLNKDCAIFFINYFGKIQDKKILDTIKELAVKYNSIIIEDTTHSIFSDNCTIGDYCISSLRKWFFVPEGGILYSNKNIDIKIKPELNELFLKYRVQAQKLKSTAVKNQSNDESYLKYFKLAEEVLDKDYLPYSMSNYSKEILEKFNYIKMIKKRKENFITLERGIKNPLVTKLIKYKEGETYLQYPILIKSRDNFRKYLFNNNIFCALHWPISENITQNMDFFLNQNILSIMIDQRYSIDDMEYIASIINKYHV